MPSRRELVMAAAKAALERAHIGLGSTETLDEYPVSNANSTNTLIGPSGLDGLAQSFQLDEDAVVTAVTFYGHHAGTPPGTEVAKIYAATGTHGTNAKPTGTAIGTSEARAAPSGSIVPHAPVEFEFPDGVLIEGGTPYCLAREYADGDGSNYIEVDGDTSAPTHAGNKSARSGGVWSAVSGDLVFVLTGGEDPRTQPSGLTVRRHPERPVEVADLPVVDLYVVGEVPGVEITQGVRKVLTLGCLARVAWNLNADEFGSGDESLDELLSWIEAALMVDDGVLDGTAAFVNAPLLSRPIVEERADKFAEALLTFDITYEARYGNPWSAP